MQKFTPTSEAGLTGKTRQWALTADEIAAKVGISARAVRKRLDLVVPDAVLAINGGQAKAWRVDQLPQDWADRIDRAEAPRADLLGLKERLDRMVDPAKPSEQEQRMFWQGAFEVYEAGAMDGTEGRQRSAEIVGFIATYCLWAGATRGAIQRQWQRKYRRWVAGGRMPSTLADLRPPSNRSRGTPVPEEDIKKLAAAMLVHGGKLAPAFRDARGRGLLSENTALRHTANPARKSYTPARIARAVMPIGRSLEDLHRGPRQAESNGAYRIRDWTKVPSGAWYSADDCTLPFYYYVSDGAGWYSLIRGQALLMNDQRSRKVLNFVLIDSRNYDAFAIHSLIWRTCDIYGLPTRGLYFENGIWRNAKLLKGDARAKTLNALNELDQGLCEFFRIQHAKTPRAKVIERILGLIQDKIESCPGNGYCGRNEQTERHERHILAKRRVMAGVTTRVHPAEAGFLNADQWKAMLEEIVNEYNAEPMESSTSWPGRRLSPNQAFEEFHDRSNPPIHMPDEFRYLLAYRRIPVTVTKNGVCIQFGSRRFVYRNARVAAFGLGAKLTVRFNPEDPDLLLVTDGDPRNVFGVPRIHDVPADADGSEVEDSSREIADFSAVSRRRYAELEKGYIPQFRRTVPDVQTAEESKAIAELESATRAERDRKRRIDRAARDSGIPMSGERGESALADLKRVERFILGDDREGSVSDRDEARTDGVEGMK